MPDMVPLMVVREKEKMAADPELELMEDDLVIIAVNSLN